MSRRKTVYGPRGFFLELNDLYQALLAQKDFLTPQTKDALARVLSWLPEMQSVEPRRTKLEKK